MWVMLLKLKKNFGHMYCNIKESRKDEFTIKYSVIWKDGLLIYNFDEYARK